MKNKPFKLGPLQKKWIKYLKENPEKQCKNFLGLKNEGKKRMCCLGAAGVIMGTCEWRGNTLYEKESDNIAVLSRSYKKLGLRGDNGKGRNGYPLPGDYSRALASLNDDPDHTWVDIAYILENNPEEYFTKSV